MSFVQLLITYIIGGVTFLPLLTLAILIHAHLTFPVQPTSSDNGTKEEEALADKDDDAQNIRGGKDLKDLAEKFRRRHEPDVASGYFAVCREYVPGGVNGKPPERTTPSGSTMIGESPSVYQSMYRSLFDRKQLSSLDPGSAGGKNVKRARNVFFVVLRHGHLMLFESAEQLEVKYVISLELHDIGIHSGEDVIPEGELWIKRNAIKLSRKDATGDTISKPFFFFSENSSDKEDFYFALLQNQEVVVGASDNPPIPLRYDQSDIISLVQKLHSSEEQLQTRWINALAGRLFLALYKTAQVEDFVRKKITKKIARVKKPAFLSNIILRKIDMGDSAPHITNPRLKDFTIDGDCCVEADFKYSGHFRIEIATTARIDLGARFRPREVDLVLAIVVKKLNGHSLLKFKPAPSNRVWISFETMPDMELNIEPVVSSRQITYGFILRTIEARIREVLAETMVLPHWDDSPFTDTTHQKFRGGIWADGQSETAPKESKIPDEVAEDEAAASVDTNTLPSTPLPKDERTMSMPALPNSASTNHEGQSFSPASERSMENVTDTASPGSPRGANPPKALRSRSFASAANPLLSMDTANFVEPTQHGSKKQLRKDATSAMIAISSRSRPSSPPDEGIHLAPEQATLWQESMRNEFKPSRAPSYSSADSGAGTPPSMSSSPSIPSTLANTMSKKSSSDPPITLGAKLSAASKDKKQTVAAINAATVAAKNWGWGVLNRHTEAKSPDPGRAGTPDHPIGRGQPLPPPGQPLPFPEGQRSKTIPISITKKKPSISGPSLPKAEQPKTRPDQSLPVPIRRRQMSIPMDNVGDDGMLVVEAPPDHAIDSPGGENGDDHAYSRSVDDRNGENSSTNSEKSSNPGPAQNTSENGDTSFSQKEIPVEDESMRAWQLDEES